MIRFVNKIIWWSEWPISLLPLFYLLATHTYTRITHCECQLDVHDPLRPQTTFHLVWSIIHSWNNKINNSIFANIKTMISFARFDSSFDSVSRGNLPVLLFTVFCNFKSYHVVSKSIQIAPVQHHPLTTTATAHMTHSFVLNSNDILKSIGNTHECEPRHILATARFDSKSIFCCCNT